MTKQKTRFTAWPILASGIILALAGLVCVFWPGLAFATVGLIVGIGFLLSGVVCLGMIFAGSTGILTSTLVLNGILDLIIGVLFCVYPVASALFIVWTIFAVLFFFGISNVVMGFREKKTGESSMGWDRIIAGVCAIVLSILIMMYPALLPIYIGIVAIVRGVMLVMVAIRAPREIVA